MREQIFASDFQIWYRVTSAVAEDALTGAMAVLSPDETRRATRFRTGADRRDYIMAHDLLRRCLSIDGGLAPHAWRFTARPSGKPALAAEHRPHHEGVSFSLAHTRGLVACAIARGRAIGVDVERVGRAGLALEVAATYFTDCEVADLGSCTGDDRVTRFVELWTLKEATLKATGQGLEDGLATWGFRLQPPSTIDCQLADGASWHFALFAPVADARIAVAVRGSVQRPLVACAFDDTSAGPAMPIASSLSIATLPRRARRTMDR